ncbi:MAG: TraR/DksA family transcriptional regulator [Nitrospinaceae bacterium]
MTKATKKTKAAKAVKKTKAAKKTAAAPKKKASVKKKAVSRAAPKSKAAAPKKTVKAAAKKAAAPKKTAAKPKVKKTKKSLRPKGLDSVVEKIRDQLIGQRNELLKMIRSSQEVERNVGDLTFSNEIDLASSLEGREMAFQLSSRERNELRMIEEALFKIKAGSYGVCEGCSQKIATKRLQIMPLTPRCIQCQESLEVG